MKSREREIELWSCCTCKGIPVIVNADELTGEAWRLARCLITTSHRVRDNGVRVTARRTNLEMARSEGWPEEKIANYCRVFGAQWSEAHPTIDWRFRPFHVWPDHRNGAYTLDTETLRLKALSYLQNEVARIVKAGGTVVSSGDYAVRLLSEGYGEEIVLLPDEQAEGEMEHQLRALFGGKEQ